MSIQASNNSYQHTGFSQLQNSKTDITAMLR